MIDTHPVVEALERHSAMLAELVEVVAWLESWVERLEQREDDDA